MKKSYLFALLLVLLLGNCSFAVIDTVPRPMSVYYNVEVDSGSTDLGATIYYLQYDPETRAAIPGTGSRSAYYANGRTTYRLAANKSYRIFVQLKKNEHVLFVPSAAINIPNLNSAKNIKLEWSATDVTLR